MHKLIIPLIVLIFLLFQQDIQANIKSPSSEFWIITPSNPEHHGFFSSFNLVLGHLYLYENNYYRQVKGIKVDFGDDGNYYCPKHGRNWWGYYFESLTLGSKINTRVRYSPADANQNAWRARRLLSRDEASRVLHSYVKIKPFMLDDAQEFVDKYFGEYTIGIHYRGTDKSTEAPRVPYEDVLQTIIEQIQILDDDHFKIFVATDELQFLDYIKMHFPEKVIATQAIRSNNSANVHTANNPPYLIGYEALLDAILLSKCNVLIRTSSSLSLWSTYYNRDIPEILLNQRYGIPYE